MISNEIIYSWFVRDEPQCEITSIQVFSDYDMNIVWPSETLTVFATSIVQYNNKPTNILMAYIKVTQADGSFGKIEVPFLIDEYAPPASDCTDAFI
jgi:hypothetical protein